MSEQTNALSLARSALQERELRIRIRVLESENGDLRQWLCDVLRALGNGAGAMPAASMQFLSHVPEEVRLEVALLRGKHVETAARSVLNKENGNG